MCWHSYGWRWERDPERTSEPANTDDLRIADSDRERAVSQLSKHAGDGRLTLDEFEGRVEEVYAAKTYAELRPVFRSLPSYDAAPPGRARADVAQIMRPLVVLAVFVLAAITFGAWVLWIGCWVLLSKFGWWRGGHRRMHRDDYDRASNHTRDEELTTV